MEKSLTKLEFQREIQTHLEFIAETRVSKILEMSMPDFQVNHSDLEEREDGKIYINPDRLRSYVGMVSVELVAMFDEALIDVVYQETDSPDFT
mgnify:CR=1 FL=1